MNTRVLTISGMTCGHCVMAVKKELTKIAGITVGPVQTGSAEVTVQDASVTDDRLRQAVEEAGYSVTGIR